MKYQIDATITIDVEMVVEVDDFQDLKLAVLEDCRSDLTFGKHSTYGGSENFVTRVETAEVTNWNCIERSPWWED